MLDKFVRYLRFLQASNRNIRYAGYVIKICTFMLRQSSCVLSASRAL
jgi:hypothetical protein